MRKREYLREKKTLNKQIKHLLKDYREYRNLDYKVLSKVIEDEYIKLCFEIEILNLTYKKGKEKNGKK